MKVKILKSFNSTILNAFEGEIYDIELDAHTFDNWVERGLIQEVKVDVKKTPRKKKVITDEN